MEVIAYWLVIVAALGFVSYKFAATDIAQRIADRIGLGDKPLWR